jgi:hypothetical protein
MTESIPIASWTVTDRLLGVLADHRDGLSGSDVVSRAPVFLSRDTIEVLLDKLLPPRKSVAPAHWEIMADQTAFLGRVSRSSVAESRGHAWASKKNHGSSKNRAPEEARRRRFNVAAGIYLAFTVLFLDYGLAPVPRDVCFARKQVRSWAPLILALAPRLLCVGSCHD